MHSFTYCLRLLLLFFISSACFAEIKNDSQAYEYCFKKKNAFIALVWPIAQGKDVQIVELFNKYGKVQYKKSFVLTDLQAYAILRASHQNITNMRDHFDWYFPGNTLEKPARLFVVSFANFNTAKKCKYAIRKLFHLGYRSIHINDTHTETVQLARFLFFNQK